MDDVELTEPKTPQARLEAVTQALRASDTDRAISLANQALDAGVETPLLLNLSAFGFEREGRLDDALRRLMRAQTLAPRDVLILTSIALTLSQQGRTEDALAYFDAALSVHPRHAPAINGRAASLVLIGDLEEGRRQHERAASVDPRFPDPLGALADLALRNGDETRAKHYAQAALGLDPHQPAATLVLAAMDGRAGNHAMALDRIERLLKGPLSPLHRAAAVQLAAEELDKLERPLEAMEAFIDANKIIREVYTPRFDQEGAETGAQLAVRLKRVIGSTSPSDWAAAEAGRGETESVAGHAFLVGFVRSGTTLLEQVLASHPAIVALEEKATLRAITPPFFSDNAGLERLTRLDADEADRLRAEYWARVRSFNVQLEGKVFVDKDPLSTLWLPMVAKLFPKAKIIFAVRDPRDVVLSAFRHRFLINALNWGYTDLEAAASFYSAVMDVAEVYREKLGLQLYEHKHEELVRDFDGEVERICRFLGLDMVVSMRDFAKTAKRRDVRTPSAEQVRRGLYSEGIGRWRRYGPAVEPMLPILAPWVRRFGYDAESPKPSEV